MTPPSENQKLDSKQFQVGLQEEREKEKKKGKKGKTFVGTSLDKALMIILAAKLTQLQASKMPKTSELPGLRPLDPTEALPLNFIHGDACFAFLALITIANSSSLQASKYA